MLIIIEGVDRTGKTTLANEIAALLPDAEVWHRGKPTMHPLREYEASLRHYVPRSGQHIILDRWHLGEWVWPTLFSRDTDLTLPMLRHISLTLQAMGALLIYASRDSEKLVPEYEEHDEPLTRHGLITALELYDEALEINTLPIMHHDFERRPLQPALAVTSAHVLESRAAKVRLITPSWIGSTEPALLLVGDEFGPGHNLERDLPVPFVPYRNTSGHFLLEELGSTSPLAIVNARRDGHPELLHALWRRLYSPRVVALGRRASAVLTEQDVPHGTVYHPQYVRRFKRRWPAGQYRRLIMEEDR